MKKNHLIRTTYGLTKERDVQVILVFHNGSELRLKEIGSGNGSDKHDEATKLARTCRDAQPGASLSGELMRDIGVEVAITTKRDFGGCVDGKLHWSGGLAVAHNGRNGVRQSSVGKLGVDSDQAYGVVIRETDLNLVSTAESFMKAHTA